MFEVFQILDVIELLPVKISKGGKFKSQKKKNINIYKRVKQVVLAFGRMSFFDGYQKQVQEQVPVLEPLDMYF